MNLKRIELALVTFGILFALLLQIQNFYTFNTGFKGKSTEFNQDISLDGRTLKISKLFGSIQITNNWSDAKSKGIVTGSGNFSDPYLIKDLIIDSGGSIGIMIENSNVYFKIENCSVYNAGDIGYIGYYSWGGAVVLLNVSNGYLNNNSCSLSTSGISLIDSNNNTLFGNTVNNNENGIFISGSNNIISGNSVNDNDHGISFYESINNTISGNLINNNLDHGIAFYDRFDLSYPEVMNNSIIGNFINNSGLGDISIGWGSNYKVSGNVMNERGLNIWGSHEELISNNIDFTNIVDGKPIYHYINEKNLKPNNFSNAGQVILVNCTDSTISNLNVSYRSMGITLYFSNNSYISGNNVNSNYKHGIGLLGCKNNNITGNTVKNNDNGIILFESINNAISGNFIRNNSYNGIDLEYSDNNTLKRNKAANNDHGIYLIKSFNNNFSGNILTNNSNNGIHLDYSDNNSLKRNKVANNEHGIYLIKSFNNNISRNIVNDNFDIGIYVYYSKNNNLLGNNASYNGGNGIQLSYECSNNRISENTANGNHASGIYLSYCKNNIISGNTANDNYINIYEAWVHGIHLYQSDNNEISGNSVNNNTNGIFLEYSDNNNITENTAYHNKLNYFNFGNGIFLLNSENNNIFGNTLNNNVGGINSQSINYNSYVNNTVIDNSYFGMAFSNGENNYISENVAKNNSIIGIGLINSRHNNISGNIANYHVLAGIGLQGCENNKISGNIVDNNMWAGIGLNNSEYNLIVGNTISNNEVGIYLALSCNNKIFENTFMNNTVADYYQEPDGYCKVNLGYNLIFLFSISAGVVVVFVGSLSIISIVQRKIPNEGESKIQSRFKYKKKLKQMRIKPEIKIKPLKVNQEKVLHGKTLRVYWYIATHNRAGVREIQKSLNLSSPGTVSYQIEKLLKAGIISKNEKNGKYYVNKELKKGILGFYVRIGFLMIPRFSLYLIINFLGFIGYLIFASLYGDKFITNPGSLLLLFFLIFGTAIFIFESIKIWKTRPSKLK